MVGKQHELANALQQLSLVNEKLAEVFNVLEKVNELVQSCLDDNPLKPSQSVQWTPEKVRELRTRFDETQEEFAARFRLGGGAVRCWEEGLGEPNGPVRVLLDHFLAMAKELKGDHVLA
jgi:DNA-binding transcriptional regulator YiaG